MLKRTKQYIIELLTTTILSYYAKEEAKVQNAMRAQKQLNYIRSLYADTARRMLVKQANKTLDEAKAALKAQRIKAEYTITVAYRRAIRQANKALGIKTLRFRKNG